MTIAQTSGNTALTFQQTNNSTTNFLIGCQYNVGNAFEITPSTAAGGSTFSSPALVVNSSGNVGIGTDSPSDYYSVPLVVATSGDQGGITIANTTANKQGMLAFADGTSGSDRYSGYIDYNHNTNVMSFGTNGGSERMRIDSSGSLLVGTTTSYADSYHTIARSIQDDSGDAVLNVVNLDNTATSFNTVLAVTQNDVVFSGVKAISFRSVGGTIASITMSNAAVAYNTSSDYRLKENIEPIQNGLERLNQLNPVKFDWKEDGTSSEGFIAHEVQEIFSDAIAGEKDGEDMQGMDYGRITPLLVKAIQEQQTIIESLEARITALES